MPEPEELLEAAAHRRDIRLASTVTLVALTAVVVASLLVVAGGYIS